MLDKTHEIEVVACKAFKYIFYTLVFIYQNTVTLYNK